MGRGPVTRLARRRRRAQRSPVKNKPEFQLAVTIFIAIAIIGTLFGLWFASQYAPQSRTNTDPAQGEVAPLPQRETPPQGLPND